MNNPQFIGDVDKQWEIVCHLALIKCVSPKWNGIRTDEGLKNDEQHQEQQQ